MLSNRVKRVIRDGGLAIGANSGSFGGSTIVEVIGHAGFDAVFIDLEHTLLDLREVREMVIAAERVDITPIVRTPGFDAGLILRLLDSGGQGICVPHVRTAAEARAVVDVVRYPPMGSRGMMGQSRAAAFGGVPLARHMRESNDEILLTVMIEDAEGLAEAAAIASVEGVDLVMVGPSDLARALGVAGRAGDPALDAAVRGIAAAVASSGNARFALPIGSAAYPLRPDEIMATGASYANCGPWPEVRLLRALSDDVRRLRPDHAGHDQPGH